jgi:hypothetical protein
MTTRKTTKAPEKLQEWRVIIKDYLTHVELSKARRAKYYNATDFQNDTIPKKYLKDGIEFDKKGRACNAKTKEVIVRNTRTAGTPRYWKINGQDLWSGNLHHATRSKMNEQLHKHFSKAIIEQIQVEQKTSVIPLKPNERVFISFLFKGKVEQSQDIDNLAIIYVKTFVDTMTQYSNKNQSGIQKLGLIPDDNVKYVRGISYEFEESSERQLEITIKKIKL